MTSEDTPGVDPPAASLKDGHATQTEGFGLSFKNVSLTRGLGSNRTAEILRDISFTVGHGEIVSIIGPTGCGKTTLLRIAMGLLAPSKGIVSLDGKDIREPNPKMGIIFQEHGLFPWLTVKQNVEFALKVRNMKSEEREVRSRAALASVGLSRDEARYPHELSGGMKRRAAVARLLANNASYLLMDEPFEALDFQTRLRMQQFLLSVHDEFSKSILLVTHQIDEALLLSDRILLMSAGPGRISRGFSVSLKRPRDLQDEVFSLYKGQILEHLKRENGGMF